MQAVSSQELARCRRASAIFASIVCAALGLSVTLGGCGDDDDDKKPSIAISGNHSLEVGKTLTLSATTNDGSDTGYTWASSDQAIATVDDQGVVTGVAAGEATITATGKDTGVKGTHAVVVTTTGGGGGEAVVVVSGQFYVKPGETTKLTAKTVNGTDSGYTWKSSDDNIATVADDGTVTGHLEGQVTITATGKDSTKEGTLGVYVATTVPNLAAWSKSAHAQYKDEAFRHWDEETPAEVPTSCARCHTPTGFADYIGADGSTAFKVDKAHAPSKGIDCQACHSSVASNLSQVTFPSGVKLENLGPEARCMTCHQGRASSDDVKKAITDAAVANADTVSSKLGFINIHYYPAGATLNAGRVRGGYQYDGKVYDVRFRHVPKYDTCVGCHDPHSLEVKVDECKTCHTGVTDKASLKKIRMIDSQLVDYDGDGDLTEGIYGELDGLREKLLKAIQAYAKEQSGLGNICYGTGYPYFFKDTDGDGTCSAKEGEYANRFDSWTPRLVKAAYNYQLAKKDPGAFAHNGKYIFQLLHDSIADLNSVLTAKVDMSKAQRNDPGHFNGAGEPARHWDEDDSVSASCSKCHGGSEGFTFFLQYGVGKAVLEQANGLDCATCHETFAPGWNTRIVDSVTFPSGKTIERKGNKSNLCLFCHQGRESGASQLASINSSSPRFRNIHYLPAAATWFGTKAGGGFEYTGKTYSADWTHTGGSNCIDCHKPKESKHTFHIGDVFTTSCTGCHAGKTKVEEVRMPKHNADYDGDTNITEPLKDELAGLATLLYSAMQTAAAASSGGAICYESHSYPYWFKDTNNDGSCDSTEAQRSNGYSGWDPKVLAAAYNYQYYSKEPGAWAHNFDYMAQLLIDGIADLGGSTTGLTRPTP